MATRLFVQHFRQCCRNTLLMQGKRTFLSDAYRSQDLWNAKANQPMFSALNLDTFYVALDKAFQTQGEVLPIDVDIFALCASTQHELDDLQDILHRFRRTPHAIDVLPSTSHTIVRACLAAGQQHREKLIQMLSDRINYGLFLDHYTCSMAMDTFIKDGNNRDAARMATHLMLQEDWEHPIARPLALYACNNYLLHPQPEPWREPDPVPDEDEETEYVRVAYLRNEWNDGHFDLKEADELIGKTLAWLGPAEPGPAGPSCVLLGWALLRRWDKLQQACEQLKQQSLCEDAVRRVTDLVSSAGESLAEPTPLLSLITSLNNVPQTLEETLKTNVLAAVGAHESKDIEAMKRLYAEWDARRLQELDRQKELIDRKKRIQALEDKRQYLRERERLLWFFDNEEQIQAEGAKQWDKPAKPAPPQYRRFIKKRRPQQEDYVPPEVRRRHSD